MNEDTRADTSSGAHPRHTEPQDGSGTAPAGSCRAASDDPAPAYHYTVEWDTSEWGTPGGD